MIIGIIGDLKSGKTEFSKILEQKLKEKEKIQLLDFEKPTESNYDLLNLMNFDNDDTLISSNYNPLKKVSNGILIIDNFGLVKDIDFHYYITYPGFMIVNIYANKQKRFDNYFSLDNTKDNTVHYDFLKDEVDYESKFKPYYKFNKLGFPVYDIINNGNKNVFEKNIDGFIKHIKDNQQARLSWDQYFIQLTWAISERSNCIKNKGGSIIVSPDYRIISTGYAGTPHGMDNCSERGCDYCRTKHSGKEKEDKKVKEDQKEKEKEKEDEKELCVCIHSEENAILEIGRKEITNIKYLSNKQEITLYSTRKPCLHCMKLICQAGIKRVCYYFDNNSEENKSFEEVDSNKFNLNLLKISLKSVFDQES